MNKKELIKKAKSIKKFRFKAPYKKDGRTNFPEASKKSGVYLIKKNGIIIYVGFSGTQLYKTLYRHFQAWNDKDQPKRISYQNQLKRNDFSVRLVYCTPKRAEALEKALVIKYQPKDNKEKYAAYINEATESHKEYINNMSEAYEFAEIETAPF